MKSLITITQARALARIHTADTDANLARKRELLAQAVRWYTSKMKGQTQEPQRNEPEMTCFETQMEIAGRVMPASIVYTFDPDDGWPIISSVKAYVVKESRYAAGKWLDSLRIERLEVDLSPIMDEYQMHVFASEINDALNADRNALRIEQMEFRKLERAAT